MLSNIENQIYLESKLKNYIIK